MNKNTKPLLLLSILGTIGSVGFIAFSVVTELSPRAVSIPGKMGDSAGARKRNAPEAKPMSFALEHDPFANSVATVANLVSPNGQILTAPISPGGEITFPSMNQPGISQSSSGMVNPALPSVMSGNIPDQTISVNGDALDSGNGNTNTQTGNANPQGPQDPSLAPNQMVNQSQSVVSPNGEQNQATGANNAPRTTFPKMILKGIVEGAESMAYLEVSGNKSKAFSVGSRPMSGVVITGMTSTSVEFTYLGESISLKVGQEVELK